jgi:hypothetical protein
MQNQSSEKKTCRSLRDGARPSERECVNRTQESGRKGMKLHGEQSIGKRSRSPKLASEKPVLAGKLF